MTNGEEGSRWRTALRAAGNEQAELLRYLGRCLLLGGWAGITSGIASALFLHALDWATATREQHGWLLWLLPLAGVASALLYGRFGQTVEGGNNLLLDRVHTPGERVPFRMVPLILLATLLTHLTGGSAGREGTAVQMGGTLASLGGHLARRSPSEHRLLLMAGISGGFGSVFGTPLAGTVFGLEVLSIGQMRYEALLPCFVAAVIGDEVTRNLGIHHEAYRALIAPTLSVISWGWIVGAGIVFGLAALTFAELTHLISDTMKARIAQAWLRPLLGGLLVIALTYVVGTRDYLGLSLPLIGRSLTVGDVFLGAFALKIVFTAVTLGSGFKGGEVTPLFCIGATLGAAFGQVTHQSPTLFAALGFVAVFAGAANTPLTCVLLGIELFGSQIALPLTGACLVSYLVSGHRGIYLSQRIGQPKADGLAIAADASLRDVRHPANPSEES